MYIMLGLLAGALIGVLAPITIPAAYSPYVAIGLLGALDSFFGGVNAMMRNKFQLKIFLSGFFGNAILAILLTVLGQILNVDIYLAAIVVFVWRMFMNLGIIRRYYVEKWTNKFAKKDKNK